MNPFIINSMPVADMEALAYRENLINDIRERVDKRRQTVILGVEGVGKTSLLNCAFDLKYRAEKALEGVIISPVTEFPDDLKSDDIYTHFAEMAVSAVDILEKCGKTADYEVISKKCREIKSENIAASERFIKIMNAIKLSNYRVVMVVDNFESFTTSKQVTKEHHSTLRSLLGNSQYIAATNYDLNQDSLPTDVLDSLYLMNFSGNEIRVGGWNKEEATKYIKDCLAEGDGIDFSEETIALIYSASGGIPLLLNLAANYVYSYIEKNGTEEGIRLRTLYEENNMMRKLFFRWCKLLTGIQALAIKQLIKNKCDITDRSILRCLYSRGIFNFKTETDTFGNERVVDERYIFCCRFFQSFCIDEKNLDTAVANHPFTKEEWTESDESRLNALKSQTKSLIRAKQNMLDSLLDEAESEVDEDIAEYTGLGRNINPESQMIKKFNEKKARIKKLKEFVEMKFEKLTERLEKSVREADFTVIQDETNLLFSESDDTLRDIMSLRNGG